MRSRCLLTCCAFGLLSLWFGPRVSEAQSPGPPSRPPAPQRVYPPPKADTAVDPRPKEALRELLEPRSTTLEIDLLQSEGAQPLESQQWGRIFDSIGRRVRVKAAAAEDQLDLTEVKRGSIRTVRLTGRIDRRGTLVFPGKTFRIGDDKALKEWLDELEAYGAQGSPVGKARWGLNTQQFQDLFKSLGTEVTIDVKGKALVDVVREFGLSKDGAVRIDPTIEAMWNATDPPLVAKQDVQGISRGSALAILLNDHDLCFRPLRTPAGAIDLVVLDRARTPDPWPPGWEPRPEVQRSDYAPGLFQFGLIGFLDQPLPEVFAECTRQSGCPIVLDLPGLARKEVDLSKKTFGLPQKKTAWFLVLQSALTGTQQVAHFRVDETGRGFLFVGPYESRSMKAE